MHLNKDSHRLSKVMVKQPWVNGFGVGRMRKESMNSSEMKLALVVNGSIGKLGNWSK